MDEIKDKIQNIKENVQEKAADAKETLQEKAAEAMADVKDVAEGVAKEAGSIKDDLTDAAKGEKPAAPAAPASPKAPAIQLPTGRGLLKMILLGAITFGIYPLVILTKISSEINTVASQHDGKSTMNFCLLVFLVGPLTLQIGTLVWWHRICNRIGAELQRRGVDYSISAKTFWGWSFLGSFIAIGPWVFVYKFLKASNLMNKDYNEKG